jgi:hypothetical protein
MCDPDCPVYHLPSPRHDINVIAEPADGKLPLGAQVVVEGVDLKPGDEVMVRGQRAVVNGGSRADAPLLGFEETLHVTPPRQPTSVLLIADGLIHGERAKEHGPVEETFGKIANIFEELLDSDEKAAIHHDIFPMTAVAKMLIALKLARLSYNRENRDNLIDAAGYIGLLDELLR